MFAAICHLVLVACVARVCERLDWLRRRPWAVGVLFGILAVVSDLLVLRVGGWQVPIRGALPIAATLCFGWRAGVVSGGVTGLWASYACWLLSSDGGPGADPVGWVTAAAVVTLYALAVGCWLFDFRRADLASAVIVAAFGAVMHFAFDVCRSSASLTVAVDAVSSVIVPDMAMHAAVTAVALLACGIGGLRRESVLTGNALAMLVFAVAFGFFVRLQIGRACRQTDAAVADAQQRLEHDIDDQIGYRMHCGADSIARCIGLSDDLSVGRMDELARMFAIDEINLVDRTGRVIASNDPMVLVNPEAFGRSEVTRSFMAVTNGVVKFVKQRFRQSRSNAAVVAKYIGVPVRGGDGLLQLGYLRTHLEDDFETFFFPMLVDMAVGDSGYYLVVDDSAGRIVNDAAGHLGIVGRAVADVGLVRPQGGEGHFEAFDAVVFGQRSRCLDKHFGRWSVYCVVPFADAYGSALLVLLFGGLQLLVICVVFRVIVRRLMQTRAKLDELRAREDARREKDMETARTIQLSSLRADDPVMSYGRIRALMTPAREVGGDFYDYFELDDGRIVVLIADVSGKGVPAALFMMRARTLLRTSLEGGHLAGETLEEVNRQLCANNDAQMFITLWVGEYCPASRHLAYVNAGHNPPLVRRADGRMEWLRRRSGLPLCALETARYRICEERLSAGDTLFLYTDGVTEAQNLSNELFGEERLEETLRMADGDLLEAVRRRLDEHVGSAEPSDDVTMLTLGIGRYDLANAGRKGVE